MANRPTPPPTLNVRCPNGHPMVVRANRATGGSFLGCQLYPDCRETAELPLYLKLLAEGAQQLPGMEDL